MCEQFAGYNILEKVFYREVTSRRNVLTGSNRPGTCTWATYLTQLPVRSSPPSPHIKVLAGCDMGEYDHKSAANLFKSVHITSPRQKMEAAYYMVHTKSHDPA